MAAIFRKMFVDHPQSVDESYIEHLLFASMFAGKLLLAGFAALVHAFIPSLFETTASKIISELHARMQKR